MAKSFYISRPFQILECHQEKVRQLNVLKSIAISMNAIKMTRGVKKLKENISSLSSILDAESLSLKNNQRDVLDLKKDVQSFQCPGTLLIQKNNLLQTLDTWGPDFNIKFDMTIVKLPTAWHNIFHFTTGDHISILGLWLLAREGKPILKVVMGKHQQEVTLGINRSYSVNLTQRNGQFSFLVNGSTVWTVNSGSTVFRNVKFFASNSWNTSAASVSKFKNLVVTTRDCKRTVTIDLSAKCSADVDRIAGLPDY